MTSRDFAYWLQGYFEIAKPTTIGVDQIQMIQKHLSMVFTHEIDPSHSVDFETQHRLDAIHLGTQVPDGPVARC